MENSKDDQKLLIAIKRSIDALILIELCKSGVSRNQARELLGTLDNNTFSRINTIFGKGKEEHAE